MANIKKPNSGCRKRPSYKLVIFDMDGTLIDSFNFHTKCFKRFLKGFDVDLSEKTIGGLIGNTIKVIFNETLPSHLHEQALNELTKFYMTEVDDLVDALQIIEGVEETAASIKASGINTAILSNSKQELVDIIASKKQLYQLFDEIKGADDASLNKVGRCKDMLNSFDAAPKEVLYVGDTSHDMRFAQTMGIKSCLVLNGYSWIKNEEVDLNSISRDYTVSSIGEIKALIGQFS